METIDEIVNRVRRYEGITLRDGHARANSGPFGEMPSVSVGEPVRSIYVAYDGPLVWLMRGYDGRSEYGESLDDVPQDPEIRRAAIALLDACEQEGVALHWEHVYSGRKLAHCPQALRQAMQTAEDIRVTRIRASTRPDPAFDRRLAQLMDLANA